MSDLQNLNRLLNMILPYPDVHARVRGTLLNARVQRNREALERSQLVVRCGTYRRALERRGVPIAYVITSRAEGGPRHRSRENYVAVCERAELDALLSCRG